ALPKAHRQLRHSFQRRAALFDFCLSHHLSQSSFLRPQKLKKVSTKQTHFKSSHGLRCIFSEPSRKAQERE
ncbi:MAG: hypothetical protein LV479_00375, partial [Methylacidiphilales bacterium]|nr:hypothetical protein [Candidatus Methylacidiphilales bacterium]